MRRIVARVKQVALSPDVVAAEKALARAVVRRLVASGIIGAAVGVIAERLLA